MAGEQKKAFIVQGVRDAQTVLEVLTRIPNYDKEYFSSGYNTSLVQGDLDPHDMTLAEFQAYITFIENFLKFATNDGTNVHGDYIATLLAARRAPGV